MFKKLKMICKLFHPSAKQTCYQSVYYTIFTTHKYGSVYFLRLFLLSNLLMFINNSSVTITYSLLSTYKLVKERSNAGYLFFFYNVDTFISRLNHQIRETFLFCLIILIITMYKNISPNFLQN